MAKVLINFTVEDHIAIAFKSRIPARERSAAIENFMSAMAHIEGTDQAEEELLEEIQSLRERLHETGNLLSEKSALLELKRAETLKQQKNVEKFAEMVTKTQVKSPWEDVPDV